MILMLFNKSVEWNGIFYNKIYLNKLVMMENVFPRINSYIYLKLLVIENTKKNAFNKLDLYQVPCII